MTLEIPEDDPVRTYSDAEKQRLSENLESVLTELYSNQSAALSVEFVCRIHRQLFDGVRGHAGKIRQAGFGSEHLVFGPARSANRRDVPKRLGTLLDSAEAVLRTDFSRPYSPSEPSRVEAALEFIARVHAEFIAIHPFEDGNGRTGRALLSYMLLRAGLHPIPIEASKHDYYVVLNAFHERGDTRPLVDLLIRLYPAGFP